MARTLRCTVTTPERKVFEGDVLSAVVPAIDGQLGILPRHAPLIGMLGYGELRLELEEGGRSRFFVDGGFLQVLGNHVSILAADALAASDLDIASEERRLEEVAAERPGAGAAYGDRERYAHAVAAAKSRLRLAHSG